MHHFTFWTWVPSQVQPREVPVPGPAGGTPARGYPILGTPIRPGWGYPARGTPPWVPPADLARGYPYWGYPTSRPGQGVPLPGRYPPWVPPIRPSWGVPLMGVPHLRYPHQTWLGRYPARGTPPQVPPIRPG